MRTPASTRNGECQTIYSDCAQRFSASLRIQKSRMIRRSVPVQFPFLEVDRYFIARSLQRRGFARQIQLQLQVELIEDISECKIQY